MNTSPNERGAKWDARFVGLAHHISEWSKDESTKVGACITRADHRVISVGHNGFPQFMPDDPEFYLNREEKLDRIIHAEMNALMFANSSVHACTLYTFPFLPCHRCSVHMAQAGIMRFVAPKATVEQEERWGESFEKTRRYAGEMGIEIVELVAS